MATEDRPGFGMPDVVDLVQCPRCADWLEKASLSVHEQWCAEVGRRRF